MDILVYAIKMELDGEKYYQEQAELNRENSLYRIFTDLANDERDHAKILEDKLRGSFYRLDAPVRASVQNVFERLTGQEACCMEQADTYKMALEKEKQSIDLYKKMLNESDGDKQLYEYLIAQEEEHYNIIEEIIRFVNRPKEWVEDAEFGKSEEY